MEAQSASWNWCWMVWWWSQMTWSRWWPPVTWTSFWRHKTPLTKYLLLSVFGFAFLYIWRPSRALSHRLKQKYKHHYHQWTNQSLTKSKIVTTYGTLGWVSWIFSWKSITKWRKNHEFYQLSNHKVIILTKIFKYDFNCLAVSCCNSFPCKNEILWTHPKIEI